MANGGIFFAYTTSNWRVVDVSKYGIAAFKDAVGVDRWVGGWMEWIPIE